MRRKKRKGEEEKSREVCESVREENKPAHEEVNFSFFLIILSNKISC